MKKLDQRVVRTRRVLADALITLALEQGYESLNIRAVTELAGVGYRTFYSYYRSLGDLLAQIMTSAFQNLIERVFRAETLQGEVLAFYTFIKEHPSVLRVYVNLPWEHPARQAIMNDATQLMRSRYAQQNETSAPLEVSIDHLILATNSLVTWYLDHIDDYTPEQAAEFHDDLVTKGIELRDDGMQNRHLLG